MHDGIAGQGQPPFDAGRGASGTHRAIPSMDPTAEKLRRAEADRAFEETTPLHRQIDRDVDGSDSGFCLQGTETELGN